MDVPDRPGGPRVLRPRPVLTWSLDALTTPRRRPHRPSAAPTVSRAGTTGRGPGWEPVPGGAHVRESPLRLAPAPVSSPRCAARATHHERREDNATFVEACGLHDSARTAGPSSGRGRGRPAAITCTAVTTQGRVFPRLRRRRRRTSSATGASRGRGDAAAQSLRDVPGGDDRLPVLDSQEAESARMGWPSSRAADASRPSQRTVSTRAR